ncbi:MAG TPA: hypothetical protein VN667_02810 [Burkholderiales bacterium]|nr:hypothetical protein [Burkholderiales bacterium]
MADANPNVANASIYPSQEAQDRLIDALASILLTQTIKAHF